MARDKRRPAAPRACGPTRETRRKLRRDVIGWLLAQRRLRLEHAEAAAEIQDTWEALGRGLFPRRDLTETVPCRTPRGRWRDPIDRMTAAEFRIWTTRYRPWSRVAAAWAFPRRRITYHAVVFAVAVANVGPRQLEDLWRLRHGSVVPALVEGLQQYCDISRASRPARKRA